ncbi:MAG: hypothetical protein WC359_12270 [Dehalococcoidia bacterium]|jgi:hypothetical protein
MSREIANLYDPGPISPVAQIKENLSVWTLQRWSHFRIDKIEPLPRSAPMVVEAITAAGGTTLAATTALVVGTIQKFPVTFLQPQADELLHLRWEPLDDVEGILWEPSGTGRFTTMSVQARVTRFSRAVDPFGATSTFFIIGRDRDMNLEVRNPNPVVVASARFAFWGYRYTLVKLDAATSDAIEAGKTASTWLPAEGH